MRFRANVFAVLQKLMEQIIILAYFRERMDATLRDTRYYLLKTRAHWQAMNNELGPAKIR